jgi:hypothetical protein
MHQKEEARSQNPEFRRKTIGLELLSTTGY